MKAIKFRLRPTAHVRLLYEGGNEGEATIAEARITEKTKMIFTNGCNLENAKQQVCEQLTDEFPNLSIKDIKIVTEDAKTAKAKALSRMVNELTDTDGKE